MKEKTYNGIKLSGLMEIYEEAYSNACTLDGGPFQVKAQIAGVEAVAKACSPHWISVKDRLPTKAEVKKHDGRFWVLRAKKLQQDRHDYNFRSDPEDVGVFFHGKFIFPTTHWMNLPELPK